MRDAKYRFFLLPLFLVLAYVGAYAQANSSISGLITDPSGAVVSGATIQVTDPATGIMRSTVSDASGLYSLGGLNAGDYTLKVTATGFETYTAKGVVVNISASFRVDVSMTIGSTSQTVTVAADALTVQTDSNVVSTLISQQQISELSTNGRNVINLATLAPGVSGNLPAMENPFSVNSSFAISFNGLNQAHNIWLIDGGEAYDRGSGGKMSVMPSQDALGEFQLLASNFAPDQGYASGGAVTMSIKSGTSKFHGEAWEFDRNDALDAHDYFDTNPSTGTTARKAELRYNIFGANLGGPFFIPGHYNSANKNKTFFFYNQEWRKMMNGVPVTPINAMPAADLVTQSNLGTGFTYQVPSYNSSNQFCTAPTYSSSSGTVVCPSGDAYPLGVILVPTVSTGSRLGAAIAADHLTMGQPFPNNVIPANLLDANALLFNTLKDMPAATNSANDTYTPSGGHLPINVSEELFRIDHNINDKWALMGHFVHDANDSVQATPEWQGDNIPTVGSNFSNPSYMAVIKLTGELKPNVLMEAAINYDGNKIAIIPVAAFGGTDIKPSGWTTGTYFGASADLQNRLPNFNWTTTGDQYGPGNDPWTNGAEDYNEYFALSVTQGKHNFKFGGGFNRYTKNQVIGNNTEGNYTFTDGWNGPTAAKPTQNQPTGVLTGDSYLDFLLGVSTNFSQPNADPINHYVNNTLSVYGMDNWHFSPRLSVQLGLRFDAMPLVWERNNQVSNFEPSLYQSALTATFNSDGSIASNSPGLQTFNFNGVQTPFYMNGVAIAGQNGVPRGLAKNDFATIEPRLGFSYDLFGNGKTVIRSGFGVFYERVQGNDIYDAAGDPPFISQPSANDVEFTNPKASWTSGTTAATPSFPQNYNSLNTHYPHPGVAEYSLGVQHELAPSIILTTQYVGNEEWDQNTWIGANNFPLSTPLETRQAYATGKWPAGTPLAGASFTSQQQNSAVTYPGFGTVNLQSNAINGSYNSLQVGLRQDSRWGLSYGAYYTWSHQIDATQTSVDVDNNNPAYDPWNLKYDKGSGMLDRRQILNINYEYKLPFFAHANGLTHDALGGWELAGTLISESGMPWFGNAAPKNNYGDTVGMGGDYSSRPEQTGPVKYQRTKVAGQGYLYSGNTNSSEFGAPTAAWDGGGNMGFGNSGKDALVGPGNTNFNTSLYKNFAFGEHAGFEFRAESFNTFNHTQFTTALSTNPESSNFGYMNGDLAPRQFELGGKFTF